MRRFLTLGLLFVASASQAAWVTIDPDDHAAGTNLSDLYSAYGITLSVASLNYSGSTASGLPIFEATSSAEVYSATLSGNPPVTGEGQSPNAATGERVFAWDPTINSGKYWDDMRGASCLFGCTQGEGFYIDHVLRLDFTIPVHSISALGWFSAGDPTSIFAFDSAQNMVSSCVQGSLSFTNDGACAQRFPTSDVNVTDSRVGWGEVNLSAGTSEIKTVFIGGHLSPRPIDRIVVNVPEPGSLVLFGSALFGFAAFRRRKKC